MGSLRSARNEEPAQFLTVDGRYWRPRPSWPAARRSTPSSAVRSRRAHATFTTELATNGPGCWQDDQCPGTLVVVGHRYRHIRRGGRPRRVRDPARWPPRRGGSPVRPWAAGRAALRPVERIAPRENGPRSANRHERQLAVPPTRDEIAALATTMNALLDRLRAAVSESAVLSPTPVRAAHPVAMLRAELGASLPGLGASRRIGRGGRGRWAGNRAPHPVSRPPVCSPALEGGPSLCVRSRHRCTNCSPPPPAPRNAYGRPIGHR